MLHQQGRARNSYASLRSSSSSGAPLPVPPSGWLPPLAPTDASSSVGAPALRPGEARREHQPLAYSPDRLHGLERTFAVATSHYRILWIHPFGDGNGRVARLATALFARRIGLGAVGLWSVSRGLARSRDRYMAALEDADVPCRHDADGCGVRSAEALARFVRFFLEVCLDQVAFMRSALRPERLGDRLGAYARLRAEGVIEGPGGAQLRPEAGAILRAVLLRGELPRGEALGATGLPERTARVVLAALLAEGLLVSGTPKGPVRLAFPSRVAPYCFPGLYPEGV